jgi:hypothetical protein
MKYREPQPIILPQVKVRRQASIATTVAAYPVHHARLSCGSCGRVATLGDCFCGYCGTRLKMGSSVLRKEGYCL